MTPTLSIITINFNNLEGLHRSMQSVFSQSYKAVEFIIIDGGSVDGSVDLIEKHTDKIDYWVSEPDNGIYNAMNKGITVAKGDYLFFLNSGDEFFADDVIEKCQPYFEEKNTCLTGNVVFFEGDQAISTKKHPEQMTFKYATSRIISHQATFIRREAFEKYGLYNEKNKIVSDSEFFFKLLALNGESYQYIDVNIAKFYFGGVSGDVALGHEERDNYLRKMLPYIHNNDYDTYVFNLFRETNSRVNYLRNIESNKVLRKLTTVILAILSKISKRIK
jgi:glycosyltransferase involved in cell wall biosynthesis